MVAIKVGSPVRGEDFFDREREQRRLWQHLATDHVLLLAPRRVGKTSLMLKLADDAAAKGFEGTLEAARPGPGRARAAASLSARGLQSDGHLVEVDEKYRFRSPMLRDFWLRRFGSGKSKGALAKKGS